MHQMHQMAFSNYSLICLHQHTHTHTHDFHRGFSLGRILLAMSMVSVDFQQVLWSHRSKFKSFCSSTSTVGRQWNGIRALRCATGLTEVSMWIWSVLFASFPTPRNTSGYLRAISARDNWLTTCTNCNEQQVEYPSSDLLLLWTSVKWWILCFCVISLQWTSKTHVQITSSGMVPPYGMSLLDPLFPVQVSRSYCM